LLKGVKHARNHQRVKILALNHQRVKREIRTFRDLRSNLPELNVSFIYWHRPPINKLVSIVVRLGNFHLQTSLCR
jgi:hypothetical protein